MFTTGTRLAGLLRYFSLRSRTEKHRAAGVVSFFASFIQYIRIALFAILGILSVQLNGQGKESAIWYFGHNAGIDFKTTPPTILTNGALNTIEGCAVMCNRAGGLLFYTDGINVYNKNHVKMPNGSGLLGDPSSTQSGIIVANPDSGNIYYIFSTSGHATKHCYFSVVDTALESGLGDVRVKNFPLMYGSTEKLTAVKHNNGRDSWVVTHQQSNAFYAYKVTGAGVDTVPVITKIGSSYNFSPGWLKFSPDGKRLVSADYFGIVEMYDFDNVTGKISNLQVLSVQQNHYGVEFSPSGRYLYLTQAFINPNVLSQYDLHAGSLANIIASRTVLQTSFNISSKPYTPGALQLAPNGKIYMALYPDCPYLGVINYPEKAGTACDFVLPGLDLSPKKSSWGLPTFNQSYLRSFDIGTSAIGCGELTFNVFTKGDTGAIISSKWNFGDGTYDSGIYTTKTFAAHGSYEIENILVTDAVSMKQDTIKMTLQTKPKPGAKIFVSNAAQCLKGNLFMLQDSSVYFTGGAKDKSVWKASNTATQYNNDSIVNLVLSKTGEVKVKLIVTSTNGCVDSVEKTITAYPSAIADFSIQTPQCIKGNLLAPAQQSIIDTPGRISGYSWNFGDNTGDTLAVPYKSFADTGNYKIRLIAKDIHGCHDTTERIITLLPSPVVAFTAANTCNKDSALIENKTTVKKGNLAYYWAYGDGTSDTAWQANKLYADTGTYLLGLKAQTENACSDSVQKIIKILPRPKADFANGKACEKNAIDFTDKTTRYFVPATQNRWYFGNSAADTATNPRYTFGVAGNYLVKLYTTSANGCADSITHIVHVNELPQVAFTVSDTAMCLKNNYLALSSQAIVPGKPLKEQTWYINGAPAGNHYFKDTVLPAAGNYRLLLKVETDNSCFDSATKTVVIHPQAVPDVVINKPNQCLNGNSFVFTNNTAVSSGSLSCHWIFSSGDVFNGYTIPPISFNGPGRYSLYFESTTDKGCLDTLTKEMFVDYSPKVDFIPQQVCANDTAIFINTSLGATSGWLWDFGDGTTSADKNPGHIFPAAGNYPVVLIGRSANGCEDTVLKYPGVVVFPAPKAYFTADSFENISGVTAITFINKSTFGSDYFWSFGNGKTSRTKSPVQKYTDTGWFRVSLSVLNSFYCFDAYDTLLYIAPASDIYIPNAFSPNKDPLNTVFKIEGTYYYHSFKMQVYNRWGQLMFSAREPETGWDGKYEGEPVPEGVYIYSITIEGIDSKINVYNGNVHLFR